MGTIRTRFIMVALVVSFFAIGMAAFLNYFKYKSTISDILRSRVVLVGQGIENSIQASLALGMQFAGLSQLPPLLERERGSDRLVRGIDVFDANGQILYSTEPTRVGTRAPSAWIAATHAAKGAQWAAEGSEELAAGLVVMNAFDLTVGHVGLRYARDEVDRAAAEAGRQILIAALGSFAGIALVAPLLLIVVIRRFERDLDTLEQAASRLESGAPLPPPEGSAFQGAIASLQGSLHGASRSLDELRARLDAAG